MRMGNARGTLLSASQEKYLKFLRRRKIEWVFRASAEASSKSFLSHCLGKK
jgi:hypothetical protein